MSIAEKEAIMSANNKTMAENQQKVYDAGYAAGQAEGGGAGGIDYMDYVTGYANLFSGRAFPENTDIVFRLNSGHLPTVVGLFMNISGVRSVKLSGGDNVVCDATNIFYIGNYANAQIETVDISELNIKFGSSVNAFLNQSALVSIIGDIDMSACTNTLNFFTHCKKLVDVRLKPGTLAISLSVGYSPLLSAESIQSIIDGLADLTGSETKTLTLHASIVLTDEQKATITAKNWTLVQ